MEFRFCLEYDQLRPEKSSGIVPGILRCGLVA